LLKKHLSEFSFVGITEKFEESVFLLCYTFDWIPIHNKIKINVAKKRHEKKDLSKEIINLVKEKTNLDTQLYNYGRELFEQRYLEMVNQLKEKYFDPRISKLSQSSMVYKMLKKRYIKKHGRKKFLIEHFQYNFRKFNFVLRYGWKTRVLKRT